MLGRRSRQLSIADVDGWQNRIPRQSVWYRMREWSKAHLTDEAFAEFYSRHGRPSIPPSYMVTLLLLQVRQGWSDREAVESAMFDDRVKFALGVSRMPEIQCDHSTLARYRSRFLETDMGRALLGETFSEAAEMGLLGNDEDLVDSFPVAGRARRQSTHVLIYRAIGRVLSEANEAGLAVPALTRSDYGQHRKSAIDWRDDRNREALLEDLVRDGRILVKAFGASEVLSVRQAADLLSLVVEQDIPDAPDGHVRIAEKTARDRILSVEDPEMRHGRKTASQKFNGYKGHVLVQNGEPDEAHLVTAIVASPANRSDGELLPTLLTERGHLTGQMPRTVQGDTAYGSMGVRDRAREVSPDTAIEAPVPPASGQQGRFGKGAFRIDTEAHTVTCPAGRVVTYEPKVFLPGHKATQAVHFPTSMCQACPLRPQCISGKKGRTVTISADESRIQRERKRQETPEWRSHYRTRSRVEHANARLTRHGARHARGHGLARLTLQLQLAAVVHNIDEMCRVRGVAWPLRRTFRPQCPQMAV